MNCDLIRNQLDAYVDNGCTPEQIAAIEDHLRTCAACAAEVLARMQLKRATRAAAAAQFIPSPEFRSRIEKVVRRSRKPVLKITWMPAFAAALTLVLIAASTILLVRHQAREQAREHELNELLDLHVATLASANPVDVVSTDRHTVKPWFQGKLPFTFNLPELQDSPFKLLGGKLVYFSHDPGAQLLFEVRKHQLSVFILQNEPASKSSASTVTAGNERGFSTESWTQAGLRYVIISDTNSADVHALGELLRAAQ